MKVTLVYYLGNLLMNTLLVGAIVGVTGGVFSLT